MITQDGFLKALLALSVIALISSVIPYFIAQSRKAAHTVPILWLSLTMGWTGVGWVAAFIWAYVDKVEEPKKENLIQGWMRKKLCSMKRSWKDKYLKQW